MTSAKSALIRIHTGEERVQTVNQVTSNNSDNKQWATIIRNKLFKNDGYQYEWLKPPYLDLVEFAFTKWTYLFQTYKSITWLGMVEIPTV